MTAAQQADLDMKVSEIKTRLTAAHRARARAEHERDAALAAAQEAQTQLREEFGVATTEQAKALLASLEAKLAEQLATLDAQLRDLGV